MVLSRLLTWTRLSLVDQEIGQISAQVRLGNFTGSRELGITVTRLLLRTHWLDLKKTVERFQDRVDQIGYDKADRSYLATQAENFRLELKQFSEKVPDVSRPSFLMAV
ncbi:uncharacterized protein T069G_11525 [Trichoderma breve]|uniref:Uncharacterized protein n=1 Tax=Trichoderma breve TaxID=2034170 RepID=A0A9W9B7Q0_9HYPO|nr:uncharacterized protein T069G_11525 [Trichoderma breve]KAJ4854546.1 hypothetical protein T069G_11525 [Trichoderma breve]